jgi:hypothetical protein
LREEHHRGPPAHALGCRCRRGHLPLLRSAAGRLIRMVPLITITP